MKHWRKQFLQLNYYDGLNISSSGTTGKPKKIHRTYENIKTCIHNACIGQEINSDSKILTVTRLTHAGGSLLQTIPALHIGAHVDCEAFNPYTFLRKINNYTHTFLPPAMMDSVTKTKGWQSCDLTGIRVVGGSDSVPWFLIEEFVDKGAIVQPNWGMSEVGPCCINATYRTQEDIDKHKGNGYILGDTFYVNWKIYNDELYIKSKQCIYDGWFATGDLVYEKDNVLYYKGRK